MTSEEFDSVMKQYLTKENLWIYAEFPEGSNEPLIRDNLGMGSVVQLYLILQLLKKVLADVWNVQDDAIDTIEVIKATALRESKNE